MVQMNNVQLLHQVHEYRSLGINVVQTRYKGKVPGKGGQWQKYRDIPPTEDQIIQWFGPDASFSNVSAITGPCSGGLTIIDFDSHDAYMNWGNRYPQLKETLPTVSTNRGYHVYTRTTYHLDDTSSFDKIDIKGRGLISMPPSMHHDGTRYRWLHPLRCHIKDLPLVDPMGWDLPKAIKSIPDTRGKVTHTTQTIQAIQNQGIEGVKEKHTIIDILKNQPEIKTVIRHTLPQRVGERNHRVFDLALGLKSIPALVNVTPKDLISVVVEWHRLAFNVIGTKEFEETWFDFERAWYNIKFLQGENPMDHLFQKAIEAPIPAICDCKDIWLPKQQLLVSWNKVLAEAHGSKPYPLSCTTIAEKLDVSRKTANNMQKLLETKQIIKEIQKGSFKSVTDQGRIYMPATTWRWIADNTQSQPTEDK